jgi:hypothetical protein
MNVIHLVKDPKILYCHLRQVLVLENFPPELIKMYFFRISKYGRTI